MPASMAGLQFAIQKHLYLPLQRSHGHAFCHSPSSQRFQQNGHRIPARGKWRSACNFDFFQPYCRCHFMGHRSKDRLHSHGNPEAVSIQRLVRSFSKRNKNFKRLSWICQRIVIRFRRDWRYEASGPSCLVLQSASSTYH